MKERARKAQFQSEVEEFENRSPQNDFNVQTSPEKNEEGKDEFKGRRVRRRRKPEEEQISDRSKLGERRRARRQLEEALEESKKPEDEMQEILQEANKLFQSNKDKKKALQEQLRSFTSSPIIENARYFPITNNTF